MYDIWGHKHPALECKKMKNDKHTSAMYDRNNSSYMTQPQCAKTGAPPTDGVNFLKL